MFGLTWMDWFGYTLENTNSPYADVPDLEGAAAPTNFLPMAGEESLAYNPNMMFSPTVERAWAPMKSRRGAVSVGGTLSTVIPVHAFGSLGEGKLYDWTLARGTWPSTSGDFHQTRSATLFTCISNMGSPVIKKIVGAKVARMTIDSAAGSNWVSLSLDIVGRSMERITLADPTIATIFTNIYGAANTVVPEYCALDSKLWTGYRLNTWTVDGDIDGWGNNTSYDGDNLNWNMVVDNKIIEDGFRLDGTGMLRRLYTGDREVTGSLGKDFRKTNDFDAFLAGTEVHLGHRLWRNVSNYLTFEMPRCVYETGGVQSSGDRGSYNKEGYGWRALGALGTETIAAGAIEPPGTIALGQEIYVREASA